METFMKTVRNALAAAVVAAFASATAFANAPAGSAAPGFTLTDLAGKPVNLADYKGKTVVLEWHNFGCPFVQKHYKSGNMQALQKKYGGDVVWLAVNSTNAGHQDYMKPEALTKTLTDFGAAPAKYLMDEPGKVGLAYGAKTTPHMYIIDGTGKVAYNGAIDDNRSANPADVKGARNYVAVALDEMKAGKPVSTPSTTPYGCTIKYK
jgi:peroxiredoxin